MTTQLDTTLECYKTAIESLKQAGSSIEVKQVLEVLKARDAVQVALKEQKIIPTSGLKQVIELDTALREKAELITKAVNCKTIEQFAQWRESIDPPAEAWWWKLESLAPPHPWDVWDWLWKGLAVAAWTANLSLLVNIATRYREEAKFVSALLLSVILISIWLALPLISNLYNRNGLKNYNERNLGEAEQDYLKAIALNADNIDAHYNLGNLYEDWQELEKAKKEYQIAVAGNLPDAHNNLGRLHIQDKKYPQAATLLRSSKLTSCSFSPYYYLPTQRAHLRCLH